MLKRLSREFGSEGRRRGEEMLEEGFEGVVRERRDGGGGGERHRWEGRRRLEGMTRLELREA